jgi:guanylate kinase
MASGKLVLLIGPSGVGKSVILKRLRKRHPEMRFPRSATTRARRPGEGDELYRFLNDAEFDAALREGKFLEWATVHGGARYGTLLEEIIPFIERGDTVIREVDVQGLESIHSHALFSGEDPRYNLVSIFLLPESTDQLIAHIQKRAPMTKDELARRLASMEKELSYASLCTAQIISREGKLDAVAREVEGVVMG